MGAKIVTLGYSFGDYDPVLIDEAPDDTAPASLVAPRLGSGAVKTAKTTKLLSGQECVEALREAQNLQYRPPQ